MFGDESSKRDDKLYEIFMDFRHTDFFPFRIRMRLFLSFAVYFDDDESKLLQKKVKDLLVDVKFHRNLLMREAWGSDSSHSIEYLDGKDNPDFNVKFEKQLLELDDLMSTFIFLRAKDLYPSDTFDVSKLKF